MKLNPAAFNAHLNHMGQRFSLRRSHACPCLDQGQPQPDCIHCSGKGRLWDDGIDGVAGIVARLEAKKYALFGVWDDGDILLSIPSDSALYQMGQYDRVIALDKREPFSVNIVHGLNDELKFRVTDVESVYWIDGVHLVQGHVPTVNTDGTLTWVVAPPAGKTFALTGKRMPEYYCFQEIPIDRPEHSGAALPRRVALRRFDLFGL